MTERSRSPQWDIIQPERKIQRGRKQTPGCQGLKGVRDGDGDGLFGYRVSFWEDENILEVERGDGGTTL